MTTKAKTGRPPKSQEMKQHQRSIRLTASEWALVEAGAAELRRSQAWIVSECVRASLSTVIAQDRAALSQYLRPEGVAQTNSKQPESRANTGLNGVAQACPEGGFLPTALINMEVLTLTEARSVLLQNQQQIIPDAQEVMQACVAPMSNKPACGAQNAECERQQPANKVDAALINEGTKAGGSATPTDGQPQQKGDIAGWLRRRSTPMGCIITGKLAGEIADRIDTLQTQQAGNKIDAERYRWLRDNNGVDNDCEVEIIIGGESRMPGRLCEQIDKAMQQGGQP